MTQKRAAIVYLEGVSFEDLEKIVDVTGKVLRERLPDLVFLFTNKKLETISLQELKRLVKEAEA